MGCLTPECKIREHTHAQAVPACIEFVLNFGQCRSGMLQAPFVDTTQNVLTERFFNWLRQIAVHSGS
jgi:hypothetical protein